MFILVILSCAKDKNTDPTPITKSDITGYVHLYDEGITEVDYSGMDVSLVGTIPIVSTKTDANGFFRLSDVYFGKYTLVYEKSGFGTFKKFDVDHNNNITTILNTSSLGYKSTTAITNLNANVIGDEVILSVTTNPAGSLGNTRYIRYFLSINSNVSDVNYSYYSPGLISQINPKDITLSKNDLINAGFLSGTTVYVKVYGDSFWSNDYTDPDLNRKVFPNLNINSSNTVYFVVP
jgi:hypothetical protein